jgi:hypothetical protein
MNQMGQMGQMKEMVLFQASNEIQNQIAKLNIANSPVKQSHEVEDQKKSSKHTASMVKVSLPLSPIFQKIGSSSSIATLYFPLIDHRPSSTNI